MRTTSDNAIHPDAVALIARNRRKAALTTASIITFSLTLLAGSLAVLSGIVPLDSLNLTERTEIGALLFVMPVLALVLALCFEVSRIALRQADLPEPRQQRALRWKPARTDE